MLRGWSAGKVAGYVEGGSPGTSIGWPLGLPAVWPRSYSVCSWASSAGSQGPVTALLTGLAVAVVMALTFVVLGGLGSGEPFRGPALAIALFATATPWILLVLQSVAAAVVAARWRGATRTSTDGTTTR